MDQKVKSKTLDEKYCYIVVDTTEKLGAQKRHIEATTESPRPSWHPAGLTGDRLAVVILMLLTCYVIYHELFSTPTPTLPAGEHTHFSPFWRFHTQDKVKDKASYQGHDPTTFTHQADARFALGVAEKKSPREEIVGAFYRAWAEIDAAETSRLVPSQINTVAESIPSR